MTAQKGASAVWRKLLYLCSEKRDHPVHEHEVKHRAHKDEQVKNLVTAKAGIIAARPLDGVEHAAHGVENAAAQHPEKAGRGEQAQQGDAAASRCRWRAGCRTGSARACSFPE